MDLTYCCGRVQVLVLFLRSRHCSLRMLSQDLLFLVSLSLPLQPYHISLSLQAHRCSAKLISSTFSGVLPCPHQSDFHVHSLQHRLVFWNASIKFMLSLKWDQGKQHVLYCSVSCSSVPPLSTFRSLRHYLHNNTSHWFCKDNLSFMMCCKSF